MQALIFNRSFVGFLHPFKFFHQLLVIEYILPGGFTFRNFFFFKQDIDIPLLIPRLRSAGFSSIFSIFSFDEQQPCAMFSPSISV